MSKAVTTEGGTTHAADGALYLPVPDRLQLFVARSFL